MSDTPRSSANLLVIGLVVVVVALAAGVGFMLWKNSTADDVVAITPVTQTPGTDAGTTTGTATPATPAQPSAEFDPATATKVPDGMTPEELVKTYHEDVVAGKYAEAYALLPLDKQQSYGDPTSYEAQVKAYGITGYEMGAPVETGDEVSIAATQITPQMPITYTWTIVKVDNVWYVKSRTMGGSTN